MNMSKLINRKKRKGFNLIELLLAMVVIGGMIVGIMVAYNKNQNTSNARQIALDVQTMSSGIKGAFASNTNGFDSIDILTAINLGLIPSTNTVTNGKVTNKYQGAVTIEKSSPNDGYTAGFAITEANLPQEVATKVVSQVGADGNLAISVNGTCIFTTGTTGADAASGCSSSTPQAYDAVKLGTAISSEKTATVSVAFSQ